jgi:hypothetical protein
MSFLGSLGANVLGGALRTGVNQIGQTWGAANNAAANAYGSKAVFDQMTGSGYGGANQNAGNVELARQQTGYDHNQYMNDIADFANADRQQTQQLTQGQLLFNENLNNARRQANYMNAMGLGDMQNRAAIANNIVNAYSQARGANANLLASLAGVGLSQQ